MLCFFNREGESLRLETRYDNDRSQFVAVVTHPDLSEHTERFSTLAAFGKWIEAFDTLFREWQCVQGGKGRSF